MPSSDDIRASLIGIRKKRHMGHEQLARRSGLTVQAVTALERDSSIAIRDLQLLCKFLGLDEPAYPKAALQNLGDRLRDHRNRAGLSRKELGRMARVSDATIKFLETATKPPSRKTFLSLLAVRELGLKWDDFADFAGPAPAQQASEPASDLVASAESSPAIRLAEVHGPSSETADSSDAGTGEVVIDLRIVGGGWAVGQLLKRILKFASGK